MVPLNIHDSQKRMFHEELEICGYKNAPKKIHREQVDEYKSGFRRKRTTANQIYSLREILVKRREYGYQVYAL